MKVTVQMCKSLTKLALYSVCGAILVACGGGNNSTSSVSSSTSSSTSSSIAFSSSSGAWQACANAGEYCAFSGLRAVRYGDGQAWQERIKEDGVDCAPAGFLTSNTDGRCEISSHFIYSAPAKSITEVQLTPLPPADPPSNGTVYLDSDIIRPSDPTSFVSFRYTGTVQRRAYHSEYMAFQDYTGYNFELTFDDGDTLEVSVDEQVGDQSAGEAEVNKIAVAIGQAPAVLRREVTVITVWSGPGRGTADRRGNVSAYASAITTLINRGNLEEFFVHEFSHTSVDKWFYTDADYIKAVALDNNYVSTYAVENPNSEDISESMTAYIAVRYRADRITAELESRILATMARRTDYFDKKLPDMYPIHNTSVNVRSSMQTPTSFATLQDFVIRFEWAALTHARSYDLVIGTQGPGSDNVRASNPIADNSIILDNLPGDGQDVFARLWTQDSNGWRYEDYRYFGFDTDEDTAHLRAPKPSSRLTSTDVHWVWDKPAEVERFDLIIGDEGPGSDNIRSSQPIAETSLTMSGLPSHGRPINVRLFSKSDVWRYRDYTFNAANDSDQAVLIAPSIGSTLTAGATQFEWDIPLRANAFDLLVGTTGPGSTDIRASDVTSNNQLTVNIPQGVSRINVRLWTNTGEWEYTDYEFNVQSLPFLPIGTFGNVNTCISSE